MSLLQDRDAYLSRKGWKQHSQNTWISPVTGMLLTVETAHIIAKQQRKRYGKKN